MCLPLGVNVMCRLGAHPYDVSEFNPTTPSGDNTMKRRHLIALAAATTLSAMPSAFAQSAGYPNRPIRLVVPFPAGGATGAAPLQRLQCGGGVCVHRTVRQAPALGVPRWVGGQCLLGQVRSAAGRARPVG